MKFRVEYQDEVLSDIQEIVDWYGDQKNGLDREFVESFKFAIAQIIDNPFVYRARTKNLRYKHLDRFPHIIIFKVIRESVIVFGVFHDKRNPRLIRKRVK